MERKQAAFITTVVILVAAVVVMQTFWRGLSVLWREGRPRGAPAQPPMWSFEGSETTRATAYWNTTGGPYHTEFGEISVPCNEDGSGCWVAWWVEGVEVYGRALGRPEVRVIGGEGADSHRIRTGSQAVQAFTFWRPHLQGMYLVQPAEVGQWYELTAWGHSWYSNCSQHAHAPYPLDYDCDLRHPLTWAHDWLRVGIDPTGGEDPFAGTVVWSEAREVYGGYAEDPLRVLARAEAERVTVFLYSFAGWALKHCDNYWEDVSLRERWVLLLPVVRREGQPQGLPVREEGRMAAGYWFALIVLVVLTAVVVAVCMRSSQISRWEEEAGKRDDCG